MAYEVNGKTIETDANGYLVDLHEWNEEVAKLIAKDEGLELTQEHWDLVHYLRDAYVNENGHQPNDREINKFLGEKWGRKISSNFVWVGSRQPAAGDGWPMAGSHPLTPPPTCEAGSHRSGPPASPRRRRGLSPAGARAHG
ncbi:MAG: TusE/DsrC/DsvC family sulfur relay protein [Gammaproteobacteria bacterium]|nr:TusE/DsrC/DsvC family sulfur relay protein [Gammaproteobacteria bacterium]